MKKLNPLIPFVVLLLILFLIWGIVGGQVASDPGVTCDMGVTKYFCLKWHKNLLGELNEVADDLKDIFAG